MSGDIVVNGTTYRQYDGEWFEVESEYRRRFLTPQEHAALVEIERLRAERTAERAWADRLAVALQEMFDPSLRDATHDEVIGVWKAAQDTLAGWEEARRER